MYGWKIENLVREGEKIQLNKYIQNLRHNKVSLLNILKSTNLK